MNKTQKKSWGMTEGTLITAALIIVGVLLQLTVGPVDWSLSAWPVNGLVLLVLLALVAIVHLLRRRVCACQFLSTLSAAVPALMLGAVLTVVMGLTRQEPQGTWLHDMLGFWPFVLIYVYITVIAGLVVVKRVGSLLTSPTRLSGKALFRHLAFLLNHAGLFVALTAGTLGNADRQQLQMWTTNNADMANTMAGEEQFHQYERFAVDEHNRCVELPLAIELKRFIMEMYADSITPRRYASEVVVYSKATNHKYGATIEVNKPVEVDGWKIYQKDYRLTDAGDACQISILELVSDPWLPWVYGGIFMMLAGALLLLLGGKKNA